MSFEALSERIERMAQDPEYQRRMEDLEAKKLASTEKARESQFAKTDIPERIRDVVNSQTLGGTEARSALSGIGIGIVVLSGPPGCGKTVAAAEWIRGIIWQQCRVSDLGNYHGNPPLFVTAHRLSRWNRYDHDAMNTLLHADRLVIDDLGSEYSDQKGNFLATIDELVSERHGNKRPMVMTTNLNAAAFKERYDERIADRIRECGNFVSLSGKSMRKRAAS